MRHLPVSLTIKEIEKIADFEELQKVWAKSHAEMMELLITYPSAKFVVNEDDVKEVFALLPEALDPYVPPFKIARRNDGRLYTIN